MPGGDVAAVLAGARRRLLDAAEQAAGRDAWRGALSGSLDFEAFRATCQRALKFVGPEEDLRVVFDSLDPQGTGSVDATEVVQFIGNPLERIRARMRDAWRKLDEDWEFFQERLDTDHGGRVDLDEFRRMCNQELSLEDHEAQVDMAFGLLDGLSGGVSVEALGAFLQGEAPAAEATEGLEGPRAEQTSDDFEGAESDSEARAVARPGAKVSKHADLPSPSGPPVAKAPMEGESEFEDDAESRREEGCAPALSGGEGFEDALPDGQAVAGEVEAGAAASEDFEVDEGDEDPGERLGLGASAAAASSWRDIAGDGAAQAAAVLGTMAADDDEDGFEDDAIGDTAAEAEYERHIGLAAAAASASMGFVGEEAPNAYEVAGDPEPEIVCGARGYNAVYAAVVPEFLEEEKQNPDAVQFRERQGPDAMLRACMPEFSEEDPFARERDEPPAEGRDGPEPSYLRDRIMPTVVARAKAQAKAAADSDEGNLEAEERRDILTQAGDVLRACPQGFSEKGLVRIDVEYHAVENTFHTKYETGTYLLTAKRFQDKLGHMLRDAGLNHEIRLNPGPPTGFRSYHNIQGWYHHGETEEMRLKTRWAARPVKRLMYPRLGAFEVRVRFPHVRHRPRGSWPGLPRELEVFSKLKRKAWPRVPELVEWLARLLAEAKLGNHEASERLLAAARNDPEVEANAEAAAPQVCDPRRYQRPERNPPMWMSLRPRSAPIGPSVPQDFGPGRCGRPPPPAFVAARPRAPGPPGVVVERLRTRMKAAAYSAAGGDFAKLLWDQDRDSTGHMTWPEFRHTCRRVLKLSGEDAHLRAIFASLDADGSGFVAIEEIVAFVQGPVEHIRVRMRIAAKAREGDAWEMLIESQATDGYIDFVQFRALCRDILGLDERESHLRAVFAQLDYERCGDVAIDDVIEFMRSDAGRRIAAAIAADDDGVESVASSGGATQPPGETASCAFAKSEAAGTVERMRSRLKGAAYTLGGQEWQRLLRDHDTEEEGWLDWFEFRFVCRNVLKLPDDNASLKLVFAHLDLMGTGKVSVEAMVSFVAKGAVSLEACMELLGQASWSNRSLIGGLREPSCRRPADGSREGSREMSQSNHRGWMGSHC